MGRMMMLRMGKKRRMVTKESTRKYRGILLKTLYFY